MKKFWKEFKPHLIWSCVVVLLGGTILSIKAIVAGEREFSALDMSYFAAEFFNAWIGLCGPYFLLQLVCFLVYKKFFYLAFLLTYSWVPYGYKHDAKDGVFSGLWILLVIIYGAYSR